VRPSLFAAGIAFAGAGVALLGGTPGFGFKPPGQAILAVPYLLFALLALQCARPKAPLILATLCLAMHAVLLHQSWRSVHAEDLGESLQVVGAFMLFGIFGPGLLALVASATILLTGLNRVRDRDARPLK
jgi:hypothetical protein